MPAKARTQGRETGDASLVDGIPLHRHYEERSDAAIQLLQPTNRWIASPRLREHRNDGRAPPPCGRAGQRTHLSHACPQSSWPTKAGHPRLFITPATKTWIAGPTTGSSPVAMAYPAMTIGRGAAARAQSGRMSSRFPLAPERRSAKCSGAGVAAGGNRRILPSSATVCPSAGQRGMP